MSILDLAKRDILQITGDVDGFGVSIKLTAPSGETTTVFGLHSKIHFGINDEGIAVNSKKAHVSFAEIALDGYPARNAKGDVSLKKHKVVVADSTGVEATYIIREHFPDETLGFIVCILGDFE